MGFDFEFVQDNQSISQTVGTYGVYIFRNPREFKRNWCAVGEVQYSMSCWIFGWAAQLMVVGKNLQQKWLSDLCARWICSWLCHFSA